MVNRILIRLKVVQMLYSYMLTRSEFRIEPAPEKQTRDSVYAYNLYLDLLLLVLRLSGQKLSPADKTRTLHDASGQNPLVKLNLPRMLATQTEIKEAGAKRLAELECYDAVAQNLLNKITESAAFRDFSKKRVKLMSDEVALWSLIINSIIKTSPEFVAVCRNHENFSLSGMERAFRMADATVRDYYDTKSALAYAKKSLDDSLTKAYELYYNLMWLPVKITRLRESQLEQAKDKYLPSADDLNPNLKFVDNKAVRIIAESPEMQKFFKEHPVDWSSDYYNLKSLLDEILDSEIYKKYMHSAESGYESDCELWRELMKQIILPSDTLAEILESKSVYWNDDVYIIGTFVLKTLRKMSTEDGSLSMLPQFKDNEDEKFGPELFADAVTHSDEYKELIDKFINTGSWDTERLAFMDLVILTAAIAEILNFEKIPVPVSLNEYIEIANYYSTSRSGQFINGILFSIINYLKAEGKLHKEFSANGPSGK